MPPGRKHEQAHTGVVCGVDEAGRGPLAGPVVAAAVILPARGVPRGVDDSKALDAAARERLYTRLMAVAQVGVGLAEAAEIDRLNILRATDLAMLRAVEALPVRPDMALVDGNRVPALPCAGTAIVRGDALCLAIAAASIIAKVVRDRLMLDYDARHPGYGFAQHKGYGTAAHLAALAARGPCPIHRLSFAPVRVAGTQHLVDESDKLLIPN